MRVVFDTNVLVSYFLTHRPPISTLIDWHLRRERFVLVTAYELLRELDRVLSYPKLQRFATPEERERFVALVMSLSEMAVLPDTIPQITRDPKDDQFIACAVAGRARWIVSGDRDLSSLGRAGRIRILAPREFLEILDRPEN